MHKKRQISHLIAASLLSVAVAFPGTVSAQEMGMDCPAGTDYAKIVRDIESSDNYQINSTSSSATGAYQFMFGTLKDLGYIASGSGWGDARWTGKGGVHSRDQFLNSPAAQDAAFAEFTQGNIRGVQGNWTPGQVVNGVPLTEGGVAMATHMLGVGGFRHWAKGGFQPSSIMKDQAAANGGAERMQADLMGRLAKGACTDPNNIIGGGGVDEIDNMPYFYLMPWEPRHRAPVVMPGDFKNLR